MSPFCGCFRRLSMNTCFYSFIWYWTIVASNSRLDKQNGVNKKLTQNEGAAPYFINEIHEDARRRSDAVGLVVAGLKYRNKRQSSPTDSSWSSVDHVHQWILYLPLRYVMQKPCHTDGMAHNERGHNTLSRMDSTRQAWSRSHRSCLSWVYLHRKIPIMHWQIWSDHCVKMQCTKVYIWTEHSTFEIWRFNWTCVQKHTRYIQIPHQ